MNIKAQDDSEVVIKPLFESHYKKIIDIPEAEIRPKFHYLKFGEFADSNIEKFMD